MNIKIDLTAAACPAVFVGSLSPEEATEMNATATPTLTELAAAVERAEAAHERACDAEALAELELDALAAEVKAFGKPRRGSAMYEVECDQLDELKSDLDDARRRVVRAAAKVTAAEFAIDAAVRAYRHARAEAEAEALDAKRAEAAEAEAKAAAVLAAFERVEFPAVEIVDGVARRAEARRAETLDEANARIAREEAEEDAAILAAFVAEVEADEAAEDFEPDEYEGEFCAEALASLAAEAAEAQALAYAAVHGVFLSLRARHALAVETASAAGALLARAIFVNGKNSDTRHAAQVLSDEAHANAERLAVELEEARAEGERLWDDLTASPAAHAFYMAHHAETNR
jgi:colicin import membrane protein